ncbi:hypothetical protein [Luteimicrobium sp. DT211]|uniref:hypothetical protein n=1 Tax=Luteimicrobium sp. DT211 TaxID=3393412 RepID=UPI003CF39B47
MSATVPPAAGPGPTPPGTPAGAVWSPRSTAPRQRTSWVRVVLSGLLGVLVGAVGTFMFAALLPSGVTDHVSAAASWPVGLVLTLALSVTAAVLTRAWGGYGAYTAYAVGWLVVVIVLTGMHGPGGDVLAGAHQRWANLWMYGGFLLVAASAFAPRGWFSDVPKDARQDGDAG